MKLLLLLQELLLSRNPLLHLLFRVKSLLELSQYPLSFEMPQEVGKAHITRVVFVKRPRACKLSSQRACNFASVLAVYGRKEAEDGGDLPFAEACRIAAAAHEVELFWLALQSFSFRQFDACLREKLLMGCSHITSAGRGSSAKVDRVPA